MAARSPLLALIIRTATISSRSAAVTAFSPAWRNPAICRLNGLPGPPLLPLANLPSPLRPAGSLLAGASAVWVGLGSCRFVTRGRSEMGGLPDMERTFQENGIEER